MLEKLQNILELSLHWNLLIEGFGQDTENKKREIHVICNENGDHESHKCRNDG